MRQIKITIPRRFGRNKHQELTGMGSLRRRLGRASRVGSVALLVLSVALALISYRYQNIVIEVDSVVAFAAGIVLLYRDTSHSVQLRVVDRILESSHDLTRSLATLSLSQSKFYYVQKGSTLQDIAVVSAGGERTSGADGGKKAIPSSSSTVLDYAGLELVPPGRSLAKLFQREMPTESFGFEDLIKALPGVVSGGLGLASAASIARTNDIVEVKLLHPVFRNVCGSSDAISTSLICETCSMFAILICQASRRTVVVDGCSRDEKRDVSTIRYRLGPASNQK